jgi:dipeptidyl aminopeptidase/acylaminoacyl peptidase
MRLWRSVVHGSVVAALAVVALGTVVAAADTRPVTFDDLMSMRAVGSAAISPDAAWVLFTVRGWESAGKDGDKNDRKESRTHVWRVPVASASPAGARQITFGDKGESAPAWSPDGRLISFLTSRGAPSDEEARPQIWVMRSDGGEGWKLTDAKEGVGAYAWAPDSKRLAFVTRDPLSKEADDKRKRRDDPRVFEGDFRSSHLWVIDLDTKQATQITEGTNLTIKGQPSWSPDGRRIACAAAPTPMIRDNRDDIYIATVESRAMEKMTTNLGPDRAPAWSPDGATIAFLSEPANGAPKGDGIPLEAVAQAHLMLLEVATKQAKDVASREFDHAAGDPVWTPDGTRILFGTGIRTGIEMVAYELATGRYTQLTRGRMIRSGSISRDGSTFAFVMDSPTEPADVYVADAAFSAPKRLTSVNPQAESFALGESEVITWKSSDGLEVEGILVKPVGFQPGRRYPLVTVVHGGPTGAHTNGYKVSAGDSGQHWAGQGWAVLYPNPRGSTNYGERFMRGNIPDWGGGDYRDIMAGVDAVMARGIADPDKLAVMGWSYGGYMTCWIVSQTGRFKAAMMGAGLSDLPSMYGTTDIPDYLGTFLGGIPSQETTKLYSERSGVTYADKVTTPLLILHGGSDERVPIGQPMEFYRALKDRGKTVELVFYPREGHGLGEYYHQLDRLRRQFEWITKHTLD